MSQYYHICSRNIGRPVEVRTVDGRVHRGVISRVTPTHLYTRPFGTPVAGDDTPAVGKQAVDLQGKKDTEEIQWGWGWGWGFGAGIALGAIASLAFLPFFWW